MANPNNPINPYTKATKLANRANIIALIAIIVAIIAAIFAGLTWQKLSSIGGRIKTNVAEIQKTIEENQLAQQAKVEDVKNQLHDQQQALATTQENISQLLKITSSSTLQRALGDVSYLVHLANLHLSVGHDVQTSKSLLISAQNRLKSLSNPELFTIKRALANDIGKLQHAQTIDTSDIIIKLDNISMQIAKLPIVSTEKITQSLNTNDTPLAEPWYKKLWHSLAGLKNLIIIRRIDKPIQPIPSQSEFLIIKENMQLKIAQAEWALLRKQPKLYQHSLHVVIQLLTDYFHDASQTNTLINELKKLAAINIKPMIPDISDSINAIAQTRTLTSDTISSPHQNNQPTNTDKNNKKIPKEKPLTPNTNTNTGVEI